MDQLAFHDIPDSIDYILATSGQPSLSYIGFSQGTAQAFATLSIHPTLNDKVDIFIALAPAMSPAGLHNSVVDALMKASPEVLFLAFGRRSLLSSVTMWQSILYPPIFVRIIDLAISFLFNWRITNISSQQKLAAYPHLYSFTSTKSVVHWFQIIRNKSFQMFDDDVQAPLSLGASDRYYKVAKFPTRNIKTPIVLLYGGCDCLVDINVMLRELPKHTVAKEIPHFEHLDFLWGQHVETLVFPYVFEALDSYARDPLKEHALMYKSVQNLSVSEDDVSSPTPGDASQVATSGLNRKRHAMIDALPGPIITSTTSRYKKYTTEPRPISTDLALGYPKDTDEESPQTPKWSRLAFNSDRGNQRSGSVSSARSLDIAKKFEKGGITLGASKATIGLIGNGPCPVGLSDEESPIDSRAKEDHSMTRS
jgi:lysosomal acid lipase/cholesteryl ester hydrolase